MTKALVVILAVMIAGNTAITPGQSPAIDPLQGLSFLEGEMESFMRPMFLPEVEQSNPNGTYAQVINELRSAGRPVPQIMHLFAYKPDRTAFLSRFTQGVMRGPSPLPAGMRELIAAFTSRRNDCPF